MIITNKKPFEEIKEALSGDDSVFIVGCEQCATMCRTGGPEQVAEMKEQLEAGGKKVSGTAMVFEPCHELDLKREFRQHQEGVDDADAVLVLSCGAGVGAAVEAAPDKTVLPGCNSLFLGNSGRQMHFYEKCSLCGDCILDRTEGICPVTRCPKGLLNGPCGGMDQGKCEVNQKKDCVWVLIYDRMERRKTLEKYASVLPAKDHNASIKPARIEEKARPMRASQKS